MMDNIDRRNMVAMEQCLKDLTEKTFAQQVRIDGLMATVSGLIERIQSLEKTLLLMRAVAQGRGPTSCIP